MCDGREQGAGGRGQGAGGREVLMMNHEFVAGR